MYPCQQRAHPLPIISLEAPVKAVADEAKPPEYVMLCYAMYIFGPGGRAELENLELIYTISIEYYWP
jgi:hypothetical protein